MHIAFPQDTFNKLITYLGNKPFNEVEDLISEIKAKIQPVEVNFPQPEPSTKEGVDEIVQSSTPESIQEAQPSQEGGIQGVQEEPKDPS